MSEPVGSVDRQVEREAQFGVLPVLPHERVWGFRDFTWVNIGLAIATWAFLIGGSMAFFVGVREGIAAAVIGNAISVSLMALATCPPSGKYGLEQYTALRSVLGRHGVKLIVIVWLIAIEIGWAAVLSIMFGRSSTNVINELTDRSFGPSSLMVTGFALVAIVIAWLVLAKGPVSIKWFATIVAPGLFIIQIVMLFLIFSEQSWGELVNIPPIEPFESRLLNFMIVVEFNLAAGFSWWPVMGSSRASPARSARPTGPT
jgi:nucleobase:cation symporter-1, NCS1 family